LGEPFNEENRMLDRERAMLLAFEERYGAGEGVGLTRAPGRVNIIGEHTDYNEGYVLPMAIGRDTMVAFRPNGTSQVNAWAMNLGQSASFSLDGEGLPAEPAWMLYVGGVARALQGAGVALTGLDMVIHSTVPIGGGLSSSAALEVSSALAMLSAARKDMEPKQLVRLCQQAEHDAVGMKCGMMDQYVSIFGQAGSAVMLDCRYGSHEWIPCATEAAKFVVCDTGVRHELASSEYNTRREECEAGVVEARRLLSGEAIQALRDLVPGELSALAPELDPVVMKRVKHVVTENARVLEAATAMRQQNYMALGVLMDASHESLRDDYQVSCPELDTMVELAWKQRGVYGARMTGGGFGGCTISLVDAEHVDAFCRNMATGYEAATGNAAHVYVCAPERGAELLRPAS
jgi:galactokinase